MNATEIIARLIDSKAINGEEAMCLLQNITPKEVFVPFNQVKEFGTHGNPYSPIYPCPEVGKVITTANDTFNTTASSTIEEKEITIDAWVARDKNGDLFLHNLSSPKKTSIDWNSNSYLSINNDLFPKVKWEDEEPTKVQLIIEKV